MIIRSFYRAFYKEENQIELSKRLLAIKETEFPQLREQGLLCITVSTYKGNLFFYYESMKEEITPAVIMKNVLDLLIQIPACNLVYFRKMYDIYHVSVPKTLEHWTRKQTKTGRIRINKVQGDKLASYIFYHFQRQEECGDKKYLEWDKYEYIGLDENLIAMYSELEPEKESEPVDTMLSTNNTPREDWGKIMNSCFEALDGEIEAGWISTNTVLNEFFI